MKQRAPDQTYVWGQAELGEVLLATQAGAPTPGQVERFMLRSVTNGVVLEVWLQPAYRPSPLIESLKAQEAGTPPGAVLTSEPEKCPDPVHELLKPDPEAEREPEDPAALFHLLGGYLPQGEAPHLRQIRAWTKFELAEVSRWARAQHAQAAPIAGREYPPLPRIPACLELAIGERKAETERLAGEPAQKRTRKKRGAGS